MAVTIEVVLPDAIADYIKKKVESGDFIDESGVVEDAVRSKQRAEASSGSDNGERVIIQYRDIPPGDSADRVIVHYVKPPRNDDG